MKKKGTAMSNYNKNIKEKDLLDQDHRKTSIEINFRTARDKLTDKRLEILRTLSEKNFNSISELVDYLDRDKKNVSTDLKELVSIGLVDIEKEGRSKKPVFDFEAVKITPIKFELNKADKKINKPSSDSKPNDRMKKLRKRFGVSNKGRSRIQE